MTDKQTHGRTDGHTSVREDGQTDGHTGKNNMFPDYSGADIIKIEMNF